MKFVPPHQHVECKVYRKIKPWHVKYETRTDISHFLWLPFCTCILSDSSPRSGESKPALSLRVDILRNRKLSRFFAYSIYSYSSMLVTPLYNSGERPYEMTYPPCINRFILWKCAYLLRFAVCRRTKSKLLKWTWNLLMTEYIVAYAYIIYIKRASPERIDFWLSQDWM